jgi:catechol 2,3-dioxygenase-like lactoylglutathione lyase family enzyme
MPDFNFVLLYVNDPLKSAAFYTDLLGNPPIESAPTFAMLKLRDGVLLGLWKRDDVQPAAAAPGSDSEIAFTVADADAVRATHTDWKRRGLPIAQAPTAMDFGETFVALDPDGHRVRVFARPARQ